MSKSNKLVRFEEPDIWFYLRGNAEYRISNKLVIVKTKNGYDVVSDENENEFEVSLFNLPKRKYDKLYLWYLSSTQLYFHPSFPEHVNMLKFLVNKNVNNKSSMIAVFKTPQTLPGNPNLRFVPGCSFLLIDNNGKPWYLTRDLKLEPKSILKPDSKSSYPTVTLGRTIRFQLHRIVALAWCVTGNEKELCIVDHIDADKSNYHPSNLRWTDYKGNSSATKLQGVHPNNKPILVRNIETKEVKEFLSITDATPLIGRSRMSFTNIELKPGKIWSGTNGHFEIKYKDDDSDWVYDELPKDNYRSSTEMKNNPLTRIGKFLKVEVPGKFIKVFKSLEDLFIDFLGIERTTAKYQNFREEILKKYPNAIIEIEEGKEYEAKNYNTNEIVTGSNLEVLGKKIGLPKSTITKYCKLGKIYNGWLIRIKNNFMDQPWPDIKEELPENTTRQYKIKNLITGEEVKIESLRKLAEHFGINRYSISKRIGSSYNGWSIEEAGKTRQDLSTDNKRSFKTGECIRNSHRE